MYNYYLYQTCQTRGVLIFLWPTATNISRQIKKKNYKILMSCHNYLRFLENRIFGIHYYIVLSSDKL